MKILTKEEEAEHYNATVKGGTLGGLMGLGIGTGVVFAANARFPVIRNLTLPMKTFLCTSAGTFSAILSADRASRSFEFKRDPQRQYRDKATQDLEAARANESLTTRFMDWGRENRYTIVTVSWVASMGIALGLVGRNPYLSKAQKLVQARVYAQGLTLAVLIATAAFEVGDANKGKGRWETVKILDPDDPEHKHLIEKRIHHEAYEGEDLWRDMVATEERKIAARKASKTQATDSKSHDDSHNTSDNKSSKTQGTESKSQQDAHKSSTQTLGGTHTPTDDPRGPKQHSGKSAKDAMVSEHKSAGKVEDHEKAHEIEEKNQQRQKEKQVAARESAVQDDAKVKDRNEWTGSREEH